MKEACMPISYLDVKWPKNQNQSDRRQPWWFRDRIGEASVSGCTAVVRTMKKIPAIIGSVLLAVGLAIFLWDAYVSYVWLWHQ